MCNTLALAKESWIKHTCKFIVAKGWPEYLYGQRLAPVTDIIRLTKFLVSISLTTALLFLFSVHTAQVQQLYHLQLVHPLEKQHCAWISSTAVHLYFSPVSVHSGTVYTTALYNCTLASASLASVLSTNHRRAWIYLLRSDWSIRHCLAWPILIAVCWPRPYPSGNGRGKKNLIT